MTTVQRATRMRAINLTSSMLLVAWPLSTIFNFDVAIQAVIGVLAGSSLVARGVTGSDWNDGRGEHKVASSLLVAAGVFAAAASVFAAVAR